MLEFLKSIFLKKQIQSINTIPSDFPLYAERAIHLITINDGQLENEQLIALFKEKGIPHQEAIELLLFLPTAFCRHMLPQVEWPNYYCEYVSQDKILELRYSDNLRYKAIEDALQSFLASDFTTEDYLKIAGRDAAFKSINELLIAGGKLESVSISPSYIIR